MPKSPCFSQSKCLVSLSLDFRDRVSSSLTQAFLTQGHHTEPIAVASGVPGTRDVRGPAAAAAAERDLVPVGKSGCSGYHGYGDPACRGPRPWHLSRIAAPAI